MGIRTWIYSGNGWIVILPVIKKLKMNIQKIIHGGALAGHRTYILSGVGILSAIAAYLIGDSDLFATLQSIFTLGGIYFLRKAKETKRRSNAKNTRKISKPRRYSKC